MEDAFNSLTIAKELYEQSKETYLTTDKKTKQSKTALLEMQRYKRTIDRLEKLEKVKPQFEPCIQAKKMLFNKEGKNVGIYVLENHDVLFWNGKYYVLDANKFMLRQFVQSKLGASATINLKNEIADCILNMEEIAITREDLKNKDKNIISLRNGMLNVVTREFTKHDSNVLSTIYIDHDYNPEAKSEAINKFLDETHYPEDKIGMLEYIGYCLIRGNPFHKYIIGLGEGRTGKSTEMKMVRCFLGLRNIASLSLRAMANDPHKICSLENKMANICSELTSKDEGCMEILKFLTSGDSTTVNRKFGMDFELIADCRFFFVTNKLLKMMEDDTSVWRRVIPIDYNNLVPEDKVDIDLLSKLTTDNEMSALLNMALDGLQRLLENKKFSFRHNSEEEIRAYYLIKTDSIHAFKEKHLFYDGVSENLVVAEVKQRYSEFCDREKLAKVSGRKFTDGLNGYFNNLDTKTVRIGKGTARVYVGLAWKDTIEKESKDTNGKTIESYGNDVDAQREYEEAQERAKKEREDGDSN